jgi:Lrp/AsnC family transcriptional regulator
MPLSDFDLKVLTAVQADCWRSNEKIAEDNEKSKASVSRSLTAMTKAGVITGYHASINPSKLGLKTTMFLLVLLENHTEKTFAEFEAALDLAPHVVEWTSITGSWDYLVKFVVRDGQHYDIERHKLQRLANVKRTRGIMANRPTKKKPIPIAQYRDDGE